ncbi:MAG: PhoH family protein, partial [Acidimicrobiia bacterium]|nr:PhoH family protein [Acidimicrobiia bacterium]
LPTGMGSGLTQAKKVLSRINGVAFITLRAVDVVRHRIVAAIVEAYQEFEDNGSSEAPESSA